MEKISDCALKPVSSIISTSIRDIKLGNENKTGITGNAPAVPGKFRSINFSNFGKHNGNQGISLLSPFKPNLKI